MPGSLREERPVPKGYGHVIRRVQLADALHPRCFRPQTRKILLRQFYLRLHRSVLLLASSATNSLLYTLEIIG